MQNVMPTELATIRRKAAPPLRHYVVIGGGCYGLVHTQALLRGRRKGYIDFERITVVDRHGADCRVRRELPDEAAIQYVAADWFEYMKGALDGMDERDEIVPAPIAPHLAFEWLNWSLARGGLRVVSEPFDYKIGLPYEFPGKEGTGFISWADFICVPNCRAPAVCPALLKPRFWEMRETVQQFAAAQARAGDPFGAVEIFQCHFCAPGVEAIPVLDYLAARDRIAAAAHCGQSRHLIATVSACHGAVNLVRVTSEGASPGG